MNSSVTSAVINQVIVMAIYIALGYILTKRKSLSQAGTKQMTFLLLNIVTPCVIVSAFLESDRDAIGELLVAFLISIAIHVIALIITKLLYFKFKNKDIATIDRFCAVYSNCGFMGIPLLSAALGPKGVIIGSTYLVIFNIFAWTQGYNSFNSGKGEFSIKKVLLTPGVIGVVAAAIILIFNIQLGNTISTVVNGLASLNTPVAMLLLGIYLGESRLIEAIRKPTLYLVCLLRLIVIPFIVVAFMMIIRIDSITAIALTLSSACPCAALSAIFAAEYGKDSGYTSSVVSVSTVLSLVTLPFIAYIASTVLM